MGGSDFFENLKGALSNKRLANTGLDE